MGYLGYKPADKPLTAADITDSIITSAKITDATIVNGDIANATIALAKLSATGTADATTFLRGDNAWSTPAAGAFVYLGETSASNVATVDLNGYFTSTYDTYVIYLDGIYGSTNDRTVKSQFATTGSYTVQTSSYYSGVAIGYRDAGAPSANVESSWNESNMLIASAMSSTATQTGSIVVTIYNPMGSDIKTLTSSFSGVSGNISTVQGGAGGGRWNSTTAITGVRFLMSTGNITARKIRIYGIKNS
jgi:hypothetical protein